MAEVSFKVIMTGEIAADFNYSDVVKTAARLFKCSPAQAQKLLGNHPTTLKRAMDKQTALLYCQQLLKAGIICRIESEYLGANATTAGKINANQAISRDTSTKPVPLAGLPRETPISPVSNITAQPTRSPVAPPKPTLAPQRRMPPQPPPAGLAPKSGLSLEPFDQEKPAQVVNNGTTNKVRISPNSANAPTLSLSLSPAQDISAQPPPQLHDTSPAPAQSPSFEPTATHEIICPKCKNIQRIASECSQCGIVFSKFVGDKHVDLPPQESENEELDESAREWEELSWFVGENFEIYRQKFAEIAQKGDKYVPQWHWPAFLVPYAWFIHRKLYALYGVYFAYMTIMIIVGVAPFISALIGNSLCALSANYVYYRFAKNKIALCDEDIDARRIDIIESGSTNSIFVTLSASLALIIFSWILIFNFMVKPVVNALMESLEQDQAFVLNGAKEEQTTRAGMVMLKNVVVGTKIAKEISGEPFDIPSNMDELREALKMEPAAADLHFIDSWENPLHYFGDSERIRIESAGIDGKWSSDDDIILESQVPRRK